MRNIHGFLDFWDGQCVSTYTAAFGSTSWSYDSCAVDSGYALPADLVIAAQPSGYLALATNDDSGRVEFYGKSPASGSTWSSGAVTAFGDGNFTEIPGLDRQLSPGCVPGPGRRIIGS
ncbi:MAG TPA: hypothetical protein VGX23_25240 [Actinocrinis sp.]|nr:hypothetical protein [Actinocrinis sp.]